MLAITSQVSRTSRDRPLPSDPTTSTSGPVLTSRSATAVVAATVEADDEEAGLAVALQRAGEVGGPGHGTRAAAPADDLPGGGGDTGRAARGHDHAVAAEGSGRAQDGAEVARVGHAVERHQRAPAADPPTVRRSSGWAYSYGRHLQHEALVRRQAAEPVELAARRLEHRDARPRRPASATRGRGRRCRCARRRRAPGGHLRAQRLDDGVAPGHRLGRVVRAAASAATTHGSTAGSLTRGACSRPVSPTRPAAPRDGWCARSALGVGPLPCSPCVAGRPYRRSRPSSTRGCAWRHAGRCCPPSGLLSQCPSWAVGGVLDGNARGGQPVADRGRRRRSPCASAPRRVPAAPRRRAASTTGSRSEPPPAVDPGRATRVEAEHVEHRAHGGQVAAQRVATGRRSTSLLPSRITPCSDGERCGHGQVVVHRLRELGAEHAAGRRRRRPRSPGARSPRCAGRPTRPRRAPRTENSMMRAVVRGHEVVAQLDRPHPLHDLGHEQACCPPTCSSSRRPRLTHALCIQQRANGRPAARDWASSFSWCGKRRSRPPPWMSNSAPRYFPTIAEHSRCQPGRPRPHGDGHDAVSARRACAPFQSAKSRGSRLPRGSASAAGSISSIRWPRELAVGRPGPHVEVDVPGAVGGGVGVPALDEGGHQLDHLGDVTGGARLVRRRQAAQHVVRRSAAPARWRRRAPTTGALPRPTSRRILSSMSVTLAMIVTS